MLCYDIIIIFCCYWCQSPTGDPDEDDSLVLHPYHRNRSLFFFYTKVKMIFQCTFFFKTRAPLAQTTSKYDKKNNTQIIAFKTTHSLLKKTPTWIQWMFSCAKCVQFMRNFPNINPKRAKHQPESSVFAFQMNHQLK